MLVIAKHKSVQAKEYVALFTNYVFGLAFTFKSVSQIKKQKIGQTLFLRSRNNF